MSEECQKYTCCGNESYTYDVTRATPNPPAVELVTLETTIDPDGGGVVSGAGNYGINTTIIVTATPAEGYKFVSWTGDYEGTNNPLNLYMDGNKSIQANFSLVSYYVSLTANPAGSATFTGMGPYSNGDVANIEAIPAANYEFDRWSGSIDSINNPETVTVNEDKNIIANLLLLEYQLSLTANPLGGGLPSGAGIYPSGQNVQISSNPNSDMVFYSWANDFISSTDPDIVLMDANKQVTANYVPSACAQPYALVLVLDQTTSIGTGGAIAGIGIIDNSSITAIGVVSFGDTICNVYPITTDKTSVRVYLQDAVENPTTSSFFCDEGGDAPENGVDALNEALNMLTAFSTSNPKAIYFKTDTASYAHNTSSAESANTLLNSSMMDITFLEFGTNAPGEGNGDYADSFPETAKVTWKGFPDCTPP